MEYLYRTTNRVNGKEYIGVHTGSPDDSYLGSGKALQQAIAKHGRENFTKEVVTIVQSDNPEFARAFVLEAEKAIVTPDYLSSMRGRTYNINCGGRGGFTKEMYDWTGKTRPESTREKFRKNLMGNTRGAGMKWNQTQRERCTFKGQTHTEETKRVLSQQKEAKFLTFNGKTQSQEAWAAELGTSHNTLADRLKRGWTVEEALGTPVGTFLKAGRTPKLTEEQTAEILRRSTTEVLTALAKEFNVSVATVSNIRRGKRVLKRQAPKAG